MENNEQSGKFGMTNSQRQRKSIFGNQRPKGENEEPKILLNGDTFSDWNITKPSTENSFYQPMRNSVSQVNFTRPFQRQDIRKNTATFFVPPENSAKNVVIGSPLKTSCIRPSSVGKSQPVFIQYKPFESPLMGKSTQSRIITGHPSANHILTSSKFIPSQSNNLLSSIIVHAPPPKRKNIAFEALPYQNTIIRHQPLKQSIVVTPTQTPVSRVVIQENPKALSEINKLSSLNQYLSQQYNLVNNELHSIKSKTYLKEVVNDFEFLQKSQNKIDDIFIRETNHALMRLDQISKCSSSKGFSKGSNSRVKCSPSAGRVRTNQTSQQYYMTAPLQHFTPVKIVEQIQNSSYVPCNHIDPMAVYDEEV